MRRVVKGNEYCSPEGTWELLEIYPSQHAMDVEDALDSIPKTYAEMFDRAVDEQVKEPQDGLQES